jgi:hypothetical protein
VIVVMDSATYNEDLTGPRKIEIPEGSRLLILAADWPVAVDPDTDVPRRTPGQFVPEGLRPHLLGNLEVQGMAPGNSAIPGGLVLNGFLIKGKASILEGNLGDLTVTHCTLVPGSGEIEVSASTTDDGKKNSRLRLSLERTISSRLTLAETVPHLHVQESILDPAGSPAEAIVAPGSAAQVHASTILGTTQAKTLEASDTIFVGPITVARRQTGCVRFSFVPDTSRIPRRYRCQPDLEIAVQIEQAEKQPAFQGLTDLQKEARRREIRADVVAWLAPSFTSTRYGHPAYGQLGRLCPRQITEGAASGSEMGAFGFLMQPQRESNLRIALEEYLRFSLEAGLFYVT